MQNKEVVNWLGDIGKLCVVFEKELHFPESYKQALIHAIKCVELMPELVDWCNRLHWIICNDHCKSNKTKCSECWMQQPIELIKKAKELIE